MNKQILVTRSSLPPIEEFSEKLASIWDSAWLTNMGKYHNELEEKLTNYLDVKNISLFVNGHLALELVIQAMNLTGEVITTPFTFASTTHAIVRNGLTPVFCDIDENDYTIDVNKIEKLITNKTSAIVPVHVYGNICNINEIEKIAKKYNLKVIYDAAHAFGETYENVGIGNFGDASMFSFHATKVFNTIEGGAITFSDEKLKAQLYKLKNFGINDETTVDVVGSNAKMNEFQAIMGLCNLNYIEEEIEKRKKIVMIYREKLGNIKGLSICNEKKGLKSNYAYFPLLVDENIFGVTRDEICEKLKDKNIYARKYFYPLTNSFDCYKNEYNVNETPCALKISHRILTLPLYANLPEEVVNTICDIILKLGKK